ncbi:hypothetical protein [Streptomyces sp. NPDC051219]|uniref:hypothetical protein n=1 Tax=Streptomyces sp. NPDC051219 TaxID=3155283 RepID=UPI003430F226
METDLLYGPFDRPRVNSMLSGCIDRVIPVFAGVRAVRDSRTVGESETGHVESLQRLAEDLSNPDAPDSLFQEHAGMLANFPELAPASDRPLHWAGSQALFAVRAAREAALFRASGDPLHAAQCALTCRESAKALDVELGVDWNVDEESSRQRQDLEGPGVARRVNRRMGEDRFMEILNRSIGLH